MARRAQMGVVCGLLLMLTIGGGSVGLALLLEARLCEQVRAEVGSLAQVSCSGRDVTVTADSQDQATAVRVAAYVPGVRAVFTAEENA